MLYLILVVVLSPVAIFLTYFRNMVILARLRGRAMRTRGQQPVPLANLEARLRARSLFGEKPKSLARYDLAFIYMSHSRYAEAEEQCRLILQQSVPPGLEALVRKRLADCLEGQNRNKEAVEERQRSEEKSGGENPDFNQLLARGQSLKRENRHEEAYIAFEQILTLAKTRHNRVLALTNMALTGYEMGRYEDAVHHAETALREGAVGKFAVLAHRVACISLSSLGKIPEAMSHIQASLELCRAMNDRDEIANSLALIANLKKKTGEIVEAMRLCEEALQTSAVARAQAYLCQTECLHTWGRFDEALAALDRSEAAQGLGIPAFERRRLAVKQLGRARIFLDLGNSDGAWESIEVARETFADDAKLNLWCLAERTVIAAMLGRMEESREDQRFMVAALTARPDDRSTHLVCESKIAHALLLRGEYGECETWMIRYLTRDPDPVNLPKAWYLIGMARQSLGNTIGAREAWQTAVSVLPHSEIYYARLAGKRLAETGSE